MSELNNTVHRQSYLPGHNPEGEHVIGLGRMRGLCRGNARITKAANVGNPVFVDQNVCLTHEVSESRLTR